METFHTPAPTAHLVNRPDLVVVVAHTTTTVPACERPVDTYFAVERPHAPANLLLLLLGFNCSSSCSSNLCNYYTRV